ncbi:uncharacterized protein LOC103311834 [Acyrthosiphon pisum]|uniref:ZNF598/HEL2 PAH domain-containing protein n=1 Tax=Acyrthosiphon pisum TaxID=7029 RepID=A0A8R2FE85_ACYPI|nr:uncharacterized protein LOC103311834 [Acyrthosiphon pisum]|eukprot:XP_008189822.1 PREDICTED: uncharacterized protein LOC103311834 [Acyrthosiphon pisum]
MDINSSNREICNKPNMKTVDAVQMCNGEIKTATSTNNKAVAGKTEVIKLATAAPVEEPKREQSNKKESVAVGRSAARPDEKPVSDANNPNDKKKTKNNENRGEQQQQQQQQPTITKHQHQLNHDQQLFQNNCIITATPKIPPGFENAYRQQPQQQVRAPPGLSANCGSSPAAQNPKDKNARTNNENRGEQQQQQPTSTWSEYQENRLEDLVTYRFTRTETLNIPPGFENAYWQQPQQQVRAPPGLSGNRGSSPAAQNHHRVNAPPGLWLTNSGSDSGSDSGIPYDYMLPVGSSDRKKMFIDNLMAAIIPVRGERFETYRNFEMMSTLFRKRVFTAFHFYDFCVEVLYPHKFESIFQELVLLLPENDLQRNLLLHYKANGRHEVYIDVCEHCHQVFSISDLESHQSVHSSTEHI